MFVLWVASWLYLSGISAKISNWSHDQTLAKTAEAGFAIQNILVEGRVHTDPDVIRAILNVTEGDSVFAVTPEKVKADLEKISWIKSAQVERRLPDTIYVGLTERTPIALWQKDQKISVVDAEGVVLTDQNLEQFQHLMMVVGTGAPQKTKELMIYLAAEPTIARQVEAAVRVADRRWDIVMKNRVKVNLPENDMGLALRQLAQAQEQDAILDKNIESIDMREGGRLTVKTAPGGAEDLKASFKGGSPI